jgi:hypothetical protein
VRKGSISNSNPSRIPASLIWTQQTSREPQVYIFLHVIEGEPGSTAASHP